MPVARVGQGQRACLQRVALQNGYQLPALAGLQHLVVQEAAEALAGDAGSLVRVEGFAGQASADSHALASAVAQKLPHAGVAHATEPDAGSVCEIVRLLRQAPALRAMRGWPQ